MSNYKITWNHTKTYYDTSNIKYDIADPINETTELDLYDFIKCGVYLINGAKGNVAIYPVFSSANTVNFLGIPQDIDDAYLVYPGCAVTVLYTESARTVRFYNLNSIPMIIGMSTWNGKYVAMMLNSSQLTTGLANNVYTLYTYYLDSSYLKIPGLCGTL